MKYFRLSQDLRIMNGVVMTELPALYRQISKGNFEGIKPMNIFFVNPGIQNYYPDILSRQIFMIKGELKKVFDLFVPYMEYKNCCLLDTTHDKYEYYYIPQLEMVSCLSEKSVCNLNKSVVSRVVLQEKQICRRNIFRISGLQTAVVIVSLGVAESILRRKINGFHLTPIELES